MKEYFNKDAKQLKDCWFYDKFFNSVIDFNFNSNRFLLFDKDGYELNSWHMRELENVIELSILEQTVSDYVGYGVGFKTLHIKLMFKLTEENKHLYNKKFTFGMKDRRG